jgi:hypothetical protein
MTTSFMKAVENNLIPPELAVEMQEAVENAVKGVRDPVRIKRARRRMDRIREEIRQERGVLDIWVAAIRELRDE